MTRGFFSLRAAGVAAALGALLGGSALFAAAPASAQVPAVNWDISAPEAFNVPVCEAPFAMEQLTLTNSRTGQLTALELTKTSFSYADGKLKWSGTGSGEDVKDELFDYGWGDVPDRLVSTLRHVYVAGVQVRIDGVLADTTFAGGPNVTLDPSGELADRPAMGAGYDSSWSGEIDVPAPGSHSVSVTPLLVAAQEVEGGTAWWRSNDSGSWQRLSEGGPRDWEIWGNVVSQANIQTCRPAVTETATATATETVTQTATVTATATATETVQATATVTATETATETVTESATATVTSTVTETVRETVEVTGPGSTVTAQGPGSTVTAEGPGSTVTAQGPEATVTVTVTVDAEGRPVQESLAKTGLGPWTPWLALGALVVAIAGLGLTAGVRARARQH